MSRFFSDTFANWRKWAKLLKREVVALWLASRDPRVPWPAKTLAAITAGYALSPIDLIPDFIPVLGLLDDLILVPLGIWVSVRLIPVEVMAELRFKAEHEIKTRPHANWIAGLAIISVWIALAVTAVYLAWPLLRRWL
jgi:uncharacterized membrane protein YkvA (DUF1232 family)